MFYTASYAAMNVGAFAVVSHFANAGERYVTLEDYEGLGRRSPLLAATLTIFLLSLIGIPMTGGFFAKFYVFSAALQANLVWLTIIGVLNSAIGAYYYLRIIVVMYMREARKEVPVSSDFARPRGGARRLALRRRFIWASCPTGFCSVVQRLGPGPGPDRHRALPGVAQNPPAAAIQTNGISFPGIQTAFDKRNLHRVHHCQHHQLTPRDQCDRINSALLRKETAISLEESKCPT